ncbi:MAG: ribbon-helix-helix protein, CopG family [Bryobacteraceae bacterium]|nr:ribbon-helix-helix protein, CopG family [Bryobacteraceae bacterium]
MGTSTSSFRIPDDLRARLEETARRLNKGKNWILNRALKEYLDRHSREGFLHEARRQSLEASRREWKDEAFWERLSDETWNG